MIYIGSRYEREEVRYQLDGKGATTRPTVLRTQSLLENTPQPGMKKFVTWNSVFRIDQVANATVGDPERWWKVMDENTEILNPWGIDAGVEVQIP